MPNSTYPNAAGTTTNPGASSVKPSLPDETKLRDDAAAVADKAKGEFDKVATEVTHQAEGLADMAKAKANEAGDRVKGLASEQKDFLAGQIGGVADAMERAADDLESRNASSASYARMIANGAETVSDTIRNHDVEEIVAMAQDFGRKQPVAFMGAAALLGFAASRFLLASAKRAETTTATQAAAQSYTPASPATSGPDIDSVRRDNGYATSGRL